MLGSRPRKISGNNPAKVTRMPRILRTRRLIRLSPVSSRTSWHSSAAGHSSSTACSRLSVRSTVATISSSSSSVPGRRAAKKVGQQTECGVPRGAVPASDPGFNRILAHIGCVSLVAASALGMQWTTRQTCRFPAPLCYVLPQGGTCIESELHPIEAHAGFVRMSLTSLVGTAKSICAAVFILHEVGYSETVFDRVCPIWANSF